MAVNPVRGRADELARARAVLRRTAETGQSGIIVLSGEPGIGKSAVLRAISQQAGRESFAVGSARPRNRLK